MNDGCNASSPVDPSAVVRISHPFHPQTGQIIDVVERSNRWGYERLFYRGPLGELTSLPTRWTSAAVEDPFVAASAGRSLFRAKDLIELAVLVAEIQPEKAAGSVK